MNLEPTLVSGDADRIDRAVSNLLENARKWSPPGEPVEVELHDGLLTSATTAPASPRPTSPTCSSASTAPTAPAS